jgi:hypothetical protein
MKRKNDTQELPAVYCGECRHFQRDTEGRSFSNETGEYFMGVCAKGLHPDTAIKQFANKKRVCNEYKSNQ